MTAPSRSEDRYLRALGSLATAFLLAVPLAVTPALIDRYRVVKESLARAEGILGAVILVLAAAFAGSERLRALVRERAVAAIVAAGVVWAVVTTLLSTHRGHSAGALVTFAGCVLVFVTAWYAAPRMSLAALDVLVPAVLINGALAAAQEYQIFQPFESSPLMPRHLTATGLIGNPNIVGTYMTLAAVIFASAATRVRGWRRWLYGFGAVCASVSVIVSETRTAVIALLGGLVLMAIGRSVKRALAVAGAVVLVLVVSVVIRVPVVLELLELPRQIATGGLDDATSGRVTPFVTALAMFRDRPLAGVGPGAFHYQYMPYKVRVTEQYGLRSTVNMNFGEAHNDHLQLLAETGLPGYALFLAFVVVLVLAVRRADDGDVRAGVAKAMIVPLAGTLLVLCLAQFPLYVPVTRHLLVTMAGLLLGWSRAWD